MTAKPFDDIIGSHIFTVSSFRVGNITIEILQRLRFHNAFPQPTERVFQRFSDYLVSGLSHRFIL